MLQKAIDIKPDNSAYYRDYAIAMAYTGNMEEAEKRWRRHVRMAWIP